MVLISATISVGAAEREARTGAEADRPNTGLVEWDKTSQQHGISLIIRVPKTEFRTGEMIKAELLIRNDSWTPKRILMPGLHGRAWFRSGSGAGVEGRWEHDPGLFARVPTKSRADFLWLQPREFWGRGYIIQYRARLGEYRVTAAYTDKLQGKDYLLVVESPIFKVTAP